MAQLKDTLIQGSARVTDTLYTTTLQVTKILAPTESNGTTFGSGTDGYVIKSNGTSVYWSSVGNSVSYNVTDRTAAAAIVNTGTGLMTERAIYYGLPTINNSHAYNSGTAIYAPSEGGTANTTALVGNGATTKPKWVNITPSISITAGTSTATPKINVTVLGQSGTTAQSLTTASTSAYGATKLTDSYTSTDSTLATTGKAILAAIQTLDVTSVGATAGTKYIAAISEADGKISATAVDVATTYSSTGTTAVSGKSIAAAIGTLDVTAITGTAAQTITSISETDGKISATYSNIAIAGTQITSGTINTARLPADVVKVYDRNSIGTSPNYDTIDKNGLFELRASSEVTGEAGTRPFAGYGPFLTFKYSNVMLQLAGNTSNGWYIRGIQSANVTLAGTAWSRLVTNSGTWDINITGSSHSVLDSGDGNATSMAYSKAGLAYTEYTWLAGWNGYELRAVNKSQFATAGHTHNYLPLSGGTLTGELNLQPASGEGGQINLKASVANTAQSGIVIDQCQNWLRIFGIASADGTTRTGTGKNFSIDPYDCLVQAWDYIFRGQHFSLRTSSSAGFTKGSATPSSTKYNGVIDFFQPGSGVTTGDRTGMVLNYLTTAGQVVTSMTAYKNVANSTETSDFKVGWTGDATPVARTWTNALVYGAVWNDYAEYRSQVYEVQPGHVVRDLDDGRVIQTEERLVSGAQVVSDTFGFAIGETEECKTPLAVAGRVLVYPYRNRYEYHAGMCVCSAPNGTVDIMTREEIINYPDCIIGIVSEIPEYEVWGERSVAVNNRIWIKVK